MVIFGSHGGWPLRATLAFCLAALVGPGVRSVAGQEGDCGDRGTLAVSVTDESGIVSIPSATVVLRWLDAERMPVREAAGLDGGLRLCVPEDATLAVLWAEFGDKSSAQATLAGLRSGENREIQLRIRDDRHSGRLLGRVVDRSTGRPVATAALSIAGRPEVVESDRMGHFRIAAVPTGAHALDVRRLGYAPLRHSVEVNTGITTDLEVGLVPEPVELEPLVVTKVRSRRLEIKGFYERKWWGERLGLGTFYEAARLPVFADPDPTTCIERAARIDRVRSKSETRRRDQTIMRRSDYLKTVFGGRGECHKKQDSATPTVGCGQGRTVMSETRARAIECVMWGLLLGCGTQPALGLALSQTPEWSVRRGITIGSVDHPIYGLSAVRGVLADADRVYVLLAQEGTVRIFTRTGEFVRDLGGQGEGPKELMNPSSMGWHGSRLWVVDPNQRRFTLFDVASGEGETIPYDVDAPLAYYVMSVVPRAILTNGQLVGSPTFSAIAVARRGGVQHLPLLVSDTSGSLRDTLALPSLGNGPVEIRAGLAANARTYLAHSLPDDDLLAFAPDGSGAVWVTRRSWAGWGPAEFEVARIGVTGDTLFRRRIGYEPREVPEGFFADEIAGSLDGPSVVDRGAHARALREFYEERRYFPPVTAVRVGSDGTTWLAGPSDDHERVWLILDASGVGIGRVRLPATSLVSTASQTEVWVVETDVLDIPYVVRYEIVP